MEGTDPFGSKNDQEEPVFIGENELDDENFVSENYQNLILLKDISKTQRLWEKRRKYLVAKKIFLHI